MLQKLCSWLAPSLCFVAPAVGSLTWAPVQLSVEGVTFEFADQMAGMVVVGDYSVCTKNGLVQIVGADGCCVGTVQQGRWALLAVLGVVPELDWS